LWVGSGGERRGRWSQQQWACRQWEISNVKNNLPEEIVVPTTGDGGGDEALQLTSDGAGDKRRGDGGR